MRGFFCSGGKGKEAGIAWQQYPASGFLPPVSISQKQGNRCSSPIVTLCSKEAGGWKMKHTNGGRTSTENRVWEIDLLRTVAIILLVVFHLVYDLNEFAGLDVNYWSGFWYWVGRAAAWTFIFLSGISSGFSRNTIKRGIRVFGFGIVITMATYFFLGEQYIR